MHHWIQLGLILGLLTGCEPTSEKDSQESVPQEPSPSSPALPAPPEDKEVQQAALEPELKEETAPEPTASAPQVSWPSASGLEVTPLNTSAPSAASPKLKPLHWNARGYAKAPWSLSGEGELSLITDTPLYTLKKTLRQRYPLTSQLDEAFAWLKTQPQVAKVTWLRDQDTLQIQPKKGAFGFYRPSDARPRHTHHR